MNKSFLVIFASPLFFSVLFFNDAAAQSTVQERIKQVENNLAENLQANDSGPMNLQERSFGSHDHLLPEKINVEFTSECYLCLGYGNHLS